MNAISKFSTDPRFTRTNERIRRYFIQNPFARQIDCAKDLDLNHTTVSRHWIVLQEEWRRGGRKPMPLSHLLNAALKTAMEKEMEDQT